MVYTFCVFFSLRLVLLYFCLIYDFFCGASTRIRVAAFPSRSHALDTPLLWKNDQLDAAIL
jgi:hypothetical protein